MKTLGLAMAIALLGGAAHAGTVFEIPINGGTARIQLDDNCEESMCASLSWTGNEGRQDHKEHNRKERAKPSTSLNTEPSANGTPPALSSAPSNGPELAAKAPPATSPAAAASGNPSVSGSVEERPEIVSGEPDANVAPASPVLAPPAKAASKPSASKTAAASPVGEWLVEDGDARIRIQECGSNLCGVVTAAKNAQDTDRKNPNPELRHRSILGMPVLLDMKPSKGNRWEGQIYNAKDGQTYTANISLNDPQRLRVEGCVFGFLCGGQNWTRVN
jgi:uncharacterized protein (DUF2147 family)